MTSHNDELNSGHQKRIDALCEKFDANKAAGLTEIADLIAEAPDSLQNAAAEALLERWFARVIRQQESMDQFPAEKLGIAPAIVERAKQSAEASVEAAQQSPTFPRWKDRFVFKRGLGVGGYGRVGLFEDRNLGRDVAIKLPKSPSDTQFSDEVMAEVRQTCRVKSSRVIQIHDVGWLWDDVPFLCEDPNDPACNPFAA